jgi:hypothetical protein
LLINLKKNNESSNTGRQRTKDQGHIAYTEGAKKCIHNLRKKNLLKCVYIFWHPLYRLYVLGP